MTAGKTILVLHDHYLPGYKAGGTLRAIANMVDALGDEFQFRILTSDRDHTQTTPYPHVIPNVWTDVGSAEVLYTATLGRAKRLLEVLEDDQVDLVYLNSLWSPQFTLLPLLYRRFGHMPSRPWLLAPRGMAAQSARDISPRKKAATAFLCRHSGLWSGLAWHATNRKEAADIVNISAGADVHIAADIPRHTDRPAKRHLKQSGGAKLVYVGRISPVKNILGMMDAIATAQVHGDLSLDLIGPIDNESYGQRCRAHSAVRSGRVRFRGPLPPEVVYSCFGNYDAFFSLTTGENFGHSIVEAMDAGLPVILSDQTPWVSASQAGWIIPLGSKDRAHAALNEIVQMAEDEHALLRAGARSIATDAHRRATDQVRSLFHSLA